MKLFRIWGLLAIVFACFLDTRPANADRPAVPPHGWEDGYVIPGDSRIHYWRTGGEKPSLLLLHGYSDDGLCWTAVAQQLQADFDIVMVDSRGHGLSDPPTESSDSVDDVMSIIQTLGLENPIIMGHSMGSATAAQFAADYPDVARAIVLEDPRLLPRLPGTAADQQAIANQQQRSMKRIVDRNNTSFAHLLSECRKNSPGWSQVECEYWARSKKLFHPQLAFRTFGDRPAIADTFKKIHVPTLILKADADDDTRKKNEEVAANLKLGQLVHIEGAGHSVHRDRFIESMQILKRFFANLP